jgi:prevent-host-death family protein
MASENVWQATEARARLPAVMEAALSGKPQVIRKRTGEEVVVLSRTDYERMKPTLKEYLLHSAGVAGDDDDESFEAALRQVRATGAMGFAARRTNRRE